MARSFAATAATKIIEESLVGFTEGNSAARKTIGAK